MNYSDDMQHSNILETVCEASCDLQGAFSDVEMSNNTVEVNADFLHHVYELLLAYALTYEGYTCSPLYAEASLS